LALHKEEIEQKLYKDCEDIIKIITSKILDRKNENEA
jgi:hypothetical protein